MDKGKEEREDEGSTEIVITELEVETPPPPPVPPPLPSHPVSFSQEAAISLYQQKRAFLNEETKNSSWPQRITCYKKILRIL